MSEFFCIYNNNKIIGVENATHVLSISFEPSLTDNQLGEIGVSYYDKTKKTSLFPNCSFKDFEECVVRFKVAKGSIKQKQESEILPFISEFTDHLLKLSIELESSAKYLATLYEKINGVKRILNDEPTDGIPLKRRKNNNSDDEQDENDVKDIKDENDVKDEQDELVDGLQFEDKTQK